MGSIAACINNSMDQLSASQGRYPAVEGLAFCFLPLPVKTNLPVHMNGYFELSSNRRDIWRGDDTTGESKVRSEWNIRLIQDVLAPLYAFLLSRMSQKLKSNNKTIENGSTMTINDFHTIRQAKCGLYSLIPCTQTISPWNLINQGVFSQIKDIELFWSNLNNGSYLSINKTVIVSDSRNTLINTTSHEIVVNCFKYSSVDKDVEVEAF